jgi:hypothetical protein
MHPYASAAGAQEVSAAGVPANRAGGTRMWSRGILGVGLVAGMTLLLAAPGHTYVYPLKLATDNPRLIVDQDGRPFFWSGDAGWSLIAQLSQADAEAYLDDRQQKGFDLVMVNLIEHAFSSNPPADHDGDLPFTGAPFATPNEAYFAHADAVIAAAAQRGIVIMLYPLYLGYGCGSEGWCAEVQAASLASMRAWGRYVGQRYGDDNNIVWCIGGDTDPTPVRAKVQEFVAGLREVDTRHLITAHNAPETFAVTPWPNESWLTINDVYSYSSSLYTSARTAYDRSPAMPFFLIESAYENEHSSTLQRLRAQAYWPVLSGGIGHVFGNCPIWHFGSSAEWCGSTDWQGQLDGSGSASMMYVQRLFLSRPWSRLVPDFDHAALTAGYGSWGSSTYATAALAADGGTLVAYLPSRRQVTVDMSTISGPEARGWWYDPAAGTATEIGTFPTSSTQQLTPPASGDWVLVVDDASRAFPPPGQGVFDPLSPSPPANLRVEQ